MGMNNLDMNPYGSFAIGAVVEIASYVATHFCLDKLGRKLPYVLSLFGAGVSLLAIFFIGNDKLLIIILAMVGKFCVSASYAIIYLYSSELFPTSIRNSCMGACSMMARIGGMFAHYKDTIVRNKIKDSY